MDSQRHRSSMKVLDLLRFNLPTCNAEFGRVDSFGVGQCEIVIRSSIDDTELFCYRGVMPTTDHEALDLVKALCRQVLIKTAH
jgi:hypothetical protein